MARVALVVMLAACSDPAAVPDAGVDAAPDAAIDLLAASPVGHDFGDYELGSGDPPKRMTFELSTTGSIAVDLTAIVIAGAAASEFSIVANDCRATLAPSETCKVGVAFVATARGERDATVQITGTSPLTIQLSGTGVPPPARISFSPPVRNFGDATAGTTGSAVTFTVSNETVATTLTPSLVGAGAAAFRIASENCTGAPVPLHGTCAVVVELVPPYGGQFVGDLALTDGGGTPWFAGLLGTGSTALELTPGSALFPSVLLGQTAVSGPLTFTIKNTGTATTGSITATPVGAAAADFTVRSTTCTTLAPDATCSVVVEMTPASRGAKYAQLTVTDAVSETRSNLRGDAYSLLLTGTAAFPDTSSGAQSAPHSFHVINASDLATGAIATTKGGADPTQFAIVSNDCAPGIAAHDECEIVLQFEPTSSGAKAASLIVTSAPGGSDSVAVTGRGL